MLALPFLSSSFRTYTENAGYEGHAFAFPTLRRERRVATSLAYLAISRPLNTNSHQWGQEGVGGGYLKKEGYLSLPPAHCIHVHTHQFGGYSTNPLVVLPSKAATGGTGLPFGVGEVDYQLEGSQIPQSSPGYAGCPIPTGAIFFSSSVGLCHRLHLNH